MRKGLYLRKAPWYYLRLFFLLFVLLVLRRSLIAQDQSKPYVLSSAKVYINGKTNLNSFKCTLEEKTLSDTINITGNWQGNNLDLEGLKLRLPVKKFDCGLDLMTHDFREIMMADLYPEIELKIDQLIFTSNPLEEISNDLSSVAFLSIGKETKIENIENGYLIQNEKMHVIGGTHHIKMTSYGLTPPTKFLGTVKVKDELSLAFELVVEPM